MQVKRDEMLEATGDAVVIYVQDADANFAVSGRSFPGGDSTGSQFVYLLNRMTILGKGSNWVLCRLPSEGSAIDLLSLEIHLR